MQQALEHDLFSGVALVRGEDLHVRSNSLHKAHGSGPPPGIAASPTGEPPATSVRTSIFSSLTLPFGSASSGCASAHSTSVRSSHRSTTRGNSAADEGSVRTSIASIAGFAELSAAHLARIRGRLLGGGHVGGGAPTQQRWAGGVDNGEGGRFSNRGGSARMPKADLKRNSSEPQIPQERHRNLRLSLPTHQHKANSPPSPERFLGHRGMQEAPRGGPMSLSRRWDFDRVGSIGEDGEEGASIGSLSLESDSEPSAAGGAGAEPRGRRRSWTSTLAKGMRTIPAMTAEEGCSPGGKSPGSKSPGKRRDSYPSADSAV